LSRRKKIEAEADGTPVETDEDMPPPVVEPKKRTLEAREVIWTKAGEENFAFSEHGTHKAGDKVSTIYADVFVKRGHATEAE
jgi:hypothetical protein